MEEIITQLEKTVKLENVELLPLLGFNDSNLKPLEERFNTPEQELGDY